MLRYSTNGKLRGELKLDDERLITAEQRKKIFGTIRDFSLEVAKEFISYLIDLCIDNEIPLSETAIERKDDINKI